MPKIKSTEEINKPSKNILLKNITGIDGDLNMTATADKGSQTETLELGKDNFCIDETIQYLLLDKIADGLELNKDISENSEGDQIDGFVETAKELAEKNFNEIKESVGNTSGKNQNKKTKFIKAFIRMFSILLNTNLNPTKKISKLIKKSVKLVQNIWQGQGLDKHPALEIIQYQEAPEWETSKSPDQETNNLN